VMVMLGSQVAYAHKGITKATPPGIIFVKLGNPKISSRVTLADRGRMMMDDSAIYDNRMLSLTRARHAQPQVSAEWISSLVAWQNWHS